MDVAYAYTIHTLSVMFYITLKGWLTMNETKKINRIYHYCSLEAFISIMENGSLRMCDIMKSNDSAEIEYGIKLLRGYLRNLCLSFCNEHIVDSDIKEFFIGIDYDELISQIIDNNQLIYYTACFSSEKDLLSQWRGYANDGKGVVIGFFTKDFMNENNFGNARFGKMIYDEEMQKNCLKECIENRLKDVVQVNGHADLCLYENAIKEAIYSILHEIAFFKNNAFKEENEWRLVCYLNYNSSDSAATNREGFQTICSDRIKEFECANNDKSLIKRKIKFKCTEKKLVSYIEFDFQNVKKSIVSDIMIGPKSQVSYADIRLFLNANEFDLSKIKVIKSNATYQ